MAFGDYFKYINKALSFIPVIAAIIEAWSDRKLEPAEIADVLDKGFEAANLENFDATDVTVEPWNGRGEGGFAVYFGARAAGQMTIE